MNRTILLTVNMNTMITISHRGIAQWLRKPSKVHHRSDIKHKRFKVGLDPDKIIEHYSRDDIDQLDPREGERTYKDAQRTIGKKEYLLPNLREEDLESNLIFQKEMDRQRAIIARIEKIRVIVDSNPGKNKVLMMNKNISTPYDCAGHVHDLVANRSVVAQLSPIEENQLEDNINQQELTTTNGDQDESITKDVHDDSKQTSQIKSKYWDMHRPIEEDCRIKFRHFQETDVSFINKAYWRSCSFVMGMAIRMAFKPQVKPMLHSWPKPNIKSGSFIYDVAINMSDKWEPTEQELRAFTKILWDIKNANLPFERLVMDKEVAMSLFKTNPFKQTQIESISEDNHGKVSVYRCGGLLDLSVGPMISNTNQIGRITLASVHPFESRSENLNGIFYRFQGVSVPQQLPLSSYLYQNLLINRAKALNKTAL